MQHFKYTYCRVLWVIHLALKFNMDCQNQLNTDTSPRDSLPAFESNKRAKRWPQVSL
jgi:hypothetical protein